MISRGLHAAETGGGLLIPGLPVVAKKKPSAVVLTYRKLK